MVKMDELQGKRVDMGNWLQLFAFGLSRPSLYATNQRLT